MEAATVAKPMNKLVSMVSKRLKTIPLLLKMFSLKLSKTKIKNVFSLAFICSPLLSRIPPRHQKDTPSPSILWVNKRTCKTANDSSPPHRPQKLEPQKLQNGHIPNHNSEDNIPGINSNEVGGISDHFQPGFWTLWYPASDTRYFGRLAVRTFDD